jgi:hypothetical protein
MGGTRRFYFRLALALGCTVGELLDRMDSKELSEWIAFDQCEPIGEWRGDYRTGMLCAMTANMHRKPGGKAFDAKDFMPFLPHEEKPSLSEAQFTAWAKSWNASRAKRDKDNAARAVAATNAKTQNGRDT